MTVGFSHPVSRVKYKFPSYTSSRLRLLPLPELWGCRPMYPECVAFLHKTMRVREIVILVHLSHSHGFAQKRNAFRIQETAPWVASHDCVLRCVITRVKEMEIYSRAFYSCYDANAKRNYGTPPWVASPFFGKIKQH